MLPMALALCLSFLCAMPSAFSQSGERVSLNLRNVTIEQALNKLKEAYGYSYVVQSEGLDLGRRLTLQIDNQSVSAAVQSIFAPQPVEVRVNGKTLSLSLRDQKTVLPEVRTYTLSGTVTDETGQPVPGAAVMESGTSNGAVTDAQGRYSLTLEKDAVLVCSCLSYQDISTAVNRNSGPVNFQLVPSREYLDEVVVVGYGTMRRSLVTSAISKMGVDDEKLRQVASPAELLNGRIAGVSSITGSGNVGAGERVSIRGASSLSAGNEPLYVIDGIPIDNRNANLTNFGEDMSALAVLNLSDIESIEILKDAASAAIYGSRATNGVVVITTKSGGEGKASLRVNLTTGLSHFPNIHKIRMADSDLYVRYFNEGVDNYNRQNGLTIRDNGYAEHIYNPFGNMPDYDWMQSITRIGRFENANVSMSGGSKGTKYYIGAAASHQEGVIRTNRMNKFNLNAKVSHRFNPWFEMGANNSGNYMKNWQVPGPNAGTMIIGRALMQRPFDRPFAPDGSYYTGGTDALKYHNALQILNEENAYLENFRYLGSYYATLYFLQDRLSFKNTLNADVSQYYDHTYYNQNHPYGLGAGRIVDRNLTTVNLLFESVLNYQDRYFDKSLDLNVMLGHSFQSDSYQSMHLDGNGFPSPAFEAVGVASTIRDYGGSKTKFAMESYFGRLTAAWKERYLLTATLRTDGSSKFARAYRWGLFPSVSLGWNISKEPFMENHPQTDLKFRISWGKTGNQEGIGRFAWQALMSGGYNYGNASGIAVSSFGNEALKWERTDQYDVGMDMGFFDDRLSVMIDGYVKNTSDLLYDMPIQATSGRTSYSANIGSIRNVGLELTVGGSVDLGQVHWESNFNISTNRNRITSLLGNDDVITIGANRVLQEGKEMGKFYLFQHDGIYQYDAEVPEAQYVQGVRAGDIRWIDANGNGTIEDADRGVIGSSNPDFFGGLSNTFTWKGLSLNVFFSYMYGNDVYMGQAPNLFASRTGLLYEQAVNRWTGPGTTNVWPRSIYSTDANNKRNSDFFLFDGSFIRLRTLTLAYNFPRKICDRLMMKGLRVYAQGDNLFLLTRYLGYDPEVSSNMDPRFFGVDNLNVPQPRMYTLGINITL